MNPTVIASLISSATTLTGMNITTRRRTKTLRTDVADALTTPTPQEVEKQ